MTITKNCEIDDAKEETHPFVSRVGFSLDESNLLLGEEKFSYGYGGLQNVLDTADVSVVGFIWKHV